MGDPFPQGFTGSNPVPCTIHSSKRPRACPSAMPSWSAASSFCRERHRQNRRPHHPAGSGTIPPPSPRTRRACPLQRAAQTGVWRASEPGPGRIRFQIMCMHVPDEELLPRPALPRQPRGMPALQRRAAWQNRAHCLPAALLPAAARGCRRSAPAVTIRETPPSAPSCPSCARAAWKIRRRPGT